MTDDRPFVDAILARPDDDGLRLVYADWLDERGDGRGEYLRLTLERAKHTSKSRKYEAVTTRLTEIEPGIDPEWVASVTRPSRLSIEWWGRQGVVRVNGQNVEWFDDPTLRNPASIFQGVPAGGPFEQWVGYLTRADVTGWRDRVTWSRVVRSVGAAAGGPFHFVRDAYERALESVRRKVLGAGRSRRGR
jgi:uncharacterized protein (TIGR02996 family)